MNTLLDYARRGLISWWRYPVAVLLALGLTFGAGAVLGVALIIMRRLPPDLAQGMLSPRDPALFFGANGVVFALLLVGFVAAVRLVHKKRIVDVVGCWRWPHVICGALSWALALLVLTGVDYALAPQTFRWSATPQTPALLGWALLALAPQTFAEEFVFRGYITQALLLATKHPLVAAAASGVLFGLLHVPNGLPQALNAVVLGFVLALIAIHTGGIGFGWGLHLVNNLFGSVIVVSGFDVFKGSPGVFTQDAPQLVWWDVIAASLAIVLLGWVVIFRTGDSTWTGRWSPNIGKTG